jgi:hypothetical protein
MAAYRVDDMPRGHTLDGPRTRGLVAVIAALGLTVSASCSRASSEAKSDEPVGAIVEDVLGFTTEGMLARQARAEVLVRDCMKAQGFEYVPIDPAAQRAELLGAAGVTEEDFERQFGYGITTLYEQRRAQKKKLGPNEAIRARLNEAERAAYDRALYGDHPDATFDKVLDTGDFTQLGGCTREAADKVFGGAETVQTLQKKLDELDEAILADARMVEAVKQWSNCMREAGYPGLSEQDEVDTVLQKKLEAIVGPPDQGGDTEPTYDKAALAALQREEVAMVRADIACERQHITAVEEKVRAEYERDFREKNADLMAKVPRP